MRRAVVLRPEPGNARTAERLLAAGLEVERAPLFAVRPVAWTPPDLTRFDALLVTSANAVRHAGPGLAALAALPVAAVGGATAEAARGAGLGVAVTGARDIAAAVELARAHGLTRLLHLAGRERMPDVPDVEPIVVYGTDPLPVSSGAARGWQGAVLLLHSARAAARAAELVDGAGARRDRIALAALSPTALAAAGGGWSSALAAPAPTDAALVELARGAALGPGRSGAAD